jgi:methanogenic corrinoid protein MtbC1
LVDVPETD